jgi:hypothetical protein
MEGARERFFLVRRSARKVTRRREQMMYTEARQSRELVVSWSPPASEEQLTALLDQPTQVRVRGLVQLCRHLSRQYEEAPEACLKRNWWRLFNQAGICLREALDHARVEGYPGMSDPEAEQAYFLLIHVAYFFEPGGVAEALWPFLPAEPGEPQAPPATSEALGLSFGAPIVEGNEIRMRQRAKTWRQRLGTLLGRNPTREKSAAALRALAEHSPPPLDEEMPLAGS